MDNEYEFVADLTATSTIWGRVNASSKEEAKQLIEAGEWDQLDDDEPHIETGEVYVIDNNIELVKEDDSGLEEIEDNDSSYTRMWLGKI